MRALFALLHFVRASLTSSVNQYSDPGLRHFSSPSVHMRRPFGHPREAALWVGDVLESVLNLKGTEPWGSLTDIL